MKNGTKIAIAIFILAGISVGAYFIIKKRKSKSQTPNPSNKDSQAITTRIGIVEAREIFNQWKKLMDDNKMILASTQTRYDDVISPKLEALDKKLSDGGWVICTIRKRLNNKVYRTDTLQTQEDCEKLSKAK